MTAHLSRTVILQMVSASVGLPLRDLSPAGKALVLTDLAAFRGLLQKHRGVVAGLKVTRGMCVNMSPDTHVSNLLLLCSYSTSQMAVVCSSSLDVS